MAYSTQRAVSDGTLQLLSLSIEFFDQSEISVFLDSIPTTAYTWATATSIHMNAVVPNGVELLVRRTTDLSKVRHEFSLGAQFSDVTLDEDFKQVLHIAQEAIEGVNVGDLYNDLNMHGHKIINLAAAVNDSDAINLGQVKLESEGAWQAAAAAQSARLASETAAANSASYRDQSQSFSEIAQTAAGQALASANAADDDRVAAQAAAASATASEAAALNYKNLAETAAFNANVSDQNAGVKTLRFLFPAATAPTTRDDGNALVTGDRYLNTTSGVEYIWKSGAWVASNLDMAQLADSSSTTLGAALVGYRPPGTGSQGMTLYAKISQALDVRDFGVDMTSSADQTTQFNAAYAEAVASKRELHIPDGTIVCSGFDLNPQFSLIGYGPGRSVIKARAGLNTGFIRSTGTHNHDVNFEGIGFDGNYNSNIALGNQSGTTVRIVGCRKRIVNCAILNSAGTSLDTDWDSADQMRALGFLDHFNHLYISNGRGHGWVHAGGSDADGDNIEIIDVGMAAANTYYGFWLKSGSGNGRWRNVHTWNRYTTTVVPYSMVQVDSSGNNFSDCHFEGGTSALTVNGGGNTFASCSYYAPRGAHAVVFTTLAIGNLLHGSFGLVTFGTNYAGLYLAGQGNIIDITNLGAGCVNGMVDFSADPGSNSVRVRGYQASGPSWVSSPHATTVADILLIGGATGGRLTQDANEVWTAYVPGVAAGSGAFTTASALGRFKKVGKTVFWNAVVTITTLGSAGTNVTLGNPFTANTSLGGSGTVMGREAALTGKALCGVTNASSTVIFFYDNTFPGAAGSVLRVGGFYEIA